MTREHSDQAPILEWALRRSAKRRAVDTVRRLALGDSVADVSVATGLPVATVQGVESFYDLLETAPQGRRCTGTACSFPGGRHLVKDADSDAKPGLPEIHCIGRCHAAPARTTEDALPIPRRALVPDPVVLRGVLSQRSDPLEEYRPRLDADEILKVLDDSGLRGRGGAAFPTGAKWHAARAADGRLKYVVANGDEGDPGSYVDRLLLEEDPHAILAGMVACARTIGARRGIVYVRGEYPAASRAVESAIDEARRAGHLTDVSDRGSPQAFDVAVVSGAGSYVCGEETALLRAIEGLRAEPSPRPPYPTTRGLWGQPTVVQNVETLAMVPWLLKHRRNPGRKAICLSGAVRRPGVVEIDLGTSLRTVLEEGGGGAPPGRRWKMALVGGPMGRVVPAGRFDVELGFDSLPGLGHGGAVVLDESVSARDLALHLFAFARSESCGSCTPCRAGTAQLHHMTTLADLNRLLDVLEVGSLCGFGLAVPRPIRDLIEHYGEEVVTG